MCCINSESDVFVIILLLTELHIEHQNPCDSTMVDDNDGTTNTAKPTQSLRPSSKSLTEHVNRYMITISSGKGCQQEAKEVHFCCLKKKLIYSSSIASLQGGKRIQCDNS